MKTLLVFLAAGLMAASAFAAESGKRWTFDAAKLKPFWLS